MECSLVIGIYLQPAVYCNEYFDIYLSTSNKVYCVHVYIPVWVAYCQWHHKVETTTRLIHLTIQTEVDGVPMYLSGFVLHDTGQGGHDPQTVP